MDAEQADTLSVILRHYAMNDAEKYAFPYYKRIVELFQYPNVCEMVKWLKEDVRKDKCVKLIQALVDKPVYGISVLTDILRGANSQKIKSAELDRIP